MWIAEKLNKAYNRLKYARMVRRMKKLPAKQQKKVGQRIYAEGYEAFCKLYNKGAEYGACSVIFECDFEGHVSYHIASALAKREQDPNDPTIYAGVERVEGTRNEWMATVLVRMDTREHAMFAADASAMSAVLSANTAKGSFMRYVASVELADDGKIPDKDKVLSELRSIGGLVAKSVPEQ